MTRVVITGVGVICAGAADWDEFLSLAEREGPVFSEWPNEASPPKISALIGRVLSYDRTRFLSQRAKQIADKYTAMSLTAAGAALEEAGLLKDGILTVSGDSIATLTGSSRPEFGGFQRFGGPMLQGTNTNPALFPYLARSVACGAMCIAFGLRGHSTNLSAGALSGLHAVGRAFDLLRTGQSPIALVGAGECLSRVSLAQSRKLFDGHFTSASPEFFSDHGLAVPAEAAVMLVMETEESAKARGRRPLAQVDQYRMGHFSRDATSENVAEYLEDQMDLVWSELDMISACASGAAKTSDLLEAEALRHLSRKFEHAPIVTACRSMTGDAEAASGVLQVAVAAHAIDSGSILPTFNAAPDCGLDIARDKRPADVRNALVTGLERNGEFFFLSLSALSAPGIEQGVEA